MRYVLNRTNGTLHKLPASESCNTDQLVNRVRFEVADDEEVVAYTGIRTKHCKRCFAEGGYGG